MSGGRSKAPRGIPSANHRKDPNDSALLVMPRSCPRLRLPSETDVAVFDLFCVAMLLPLDRHYNLQTGMRIAECAATALAVGVRAAAQTKEM